MGNRGTKSSTSKPRERVMLYRVMQCLGLCGLALQLPAQDLQFKQSAHSDKQAFTIARATEDAGSKITALRGFIHAYPQSHLVERAQWEIFNTLAKRLPQRIDEIRAQARGLIADAGPDYDSVETRAEIADTLANAHVDLDDALLWARSASDELTEQHWNQWEQASRRAAGQGDAQTPAESHRQFDNARAETLAALANVQWHRGDARATESTLQQAAALDPDSDEINALRGELAWAAHRPAEALDAYERAQLAGELQPVQRQHFLEAYRSTHHGSLDGLEQALDARYAASYPSPIAHAPAASSPGNRTVLVELFTGSGCPPCAAADLALEGVQNNYSRRQVVVLALDQHIPRPDPLATPQTVARAKWYDIAGTPTFFVDGREADVDGGSRRHAVQTYQSLSQAILKRITVPASLSLQAQASRDAHGKVEVNVQLNPAQQPGTTPPTVHVALVEDHVRYSGENGIRFHEAVVRALADATGAGGHLQASFDIPSLQQQQRAYLDGYEQHNDRYGPIQFLSKNTQLDPAHLSVVVFAQDPVTRVVQQADFVTVAGG
ncbi:DUF1223 domain-containing protein [Frateuria aurantia]